MRSIEGRTLLITGAGSGIGRATACLFAEDGANVAVTDVDYNAALNVATGINNSGGCAHAWPLDVSDASAIGRVVEEAAAHFGGIDVVVNNAGMGQFMALDDPDYERLWEKMVAVLLTGCQRVTRAALSHLRASEFPRIVNIASTEGLGATVNSSIYVSAKTGVVGLTRALAVELGPEGITANCICPGPINTGLTAVIDDSDKARFAARRTALRRYGEPGEVAHVIWSLCLPGASYITGAIIPVDGGLVARNA